MYKDPILLGQVVQTSDSAIHRINLYPVDSVIGFHNTYPLDSDLSGGYRYPTFEQPGPAVTLVLASKIEFLLQEVLLFGKEEKLMFVMTKIMVAPARRSSSISLSVRRFWGKRERWI